MEDAPRDVAGGIRQERSPVTAEDLVNAGLDPVEAFARHAPQDLRCYPILSEGGWFIVIKNVTTLEELARRPWRLLGPIELLSHNLALD